MKGDFVTNLWMLSLLFFVSLVQWVESANLFSAFTSSVGSLFSEQEEAPYELIKEGKGYEERTYEALNWVCAPEAPLDESASRQHKVFLKLLEYLQKGNEKALEIDMSVPVSIEMIKMNPKNATLSACFFLGGEAQLSPPAPNDTNLSIQSKGPFTVFTREFDGFVDSSSKWIEEAKSLIEVLKEAGEKFREDLMYWNAFDSPLRFWNRRNEVWILKEEA